MNGPVVDERTFAAIRDQMALVPMIHSEPEIEPSPCGAKTFDGANWLVCTRGRHRLGGHRFAIHTRAD